MEPIGSNIITLPRWEGMKFDHRDEAGKGLTEENHPPERGPTNFRASSPQGSEGWRAQRF